MKLGVIAMNHTNIFKVLGLSVITCLVTHADDGTLTKAMQSGPSGKSTVKTVDKTVVIEKDERLTQDHGIEFRIGPVLNTFNDINVQVGRHAQSFGLEQLDMNDAISYGAKVDVDATFGERSHFNTSITWINFNEDQILDRRLTFGTGSKLNRGSRVKVDLDIITLEPRYGYDVFRDETFRVMPYVGGIFGVATGEFTAVSGTQTRENGKVTTIDRPKTYDATRFYGTYVVGFETQAHITRDLYVGLDLGGYYMGFLDGAIAKGYINYDINKTWSVRGGVDENWLQYEGKNDSADGRTTNFYTQLGVKF
ncbi:MAG: hypothetical protein V4507_16415 [Verrucomicrobiota bacterium]